MEGAWTQLTSSFASHKRYTELAFKLCESQLLTSKTHETAAAVETRIVCANPKGRCSVVWGDAVWCGEMQ